MNRKELLGMRRIMATPKMIEAARQDAPQRRTVHTYWQTYYDVQRKYQLFLRCRVENGILKVALFYPDNLRAGGRLPSYEVFIDRKARRFITYDCINRKWLSAKVDRLDWPHYMPMYPGVWMTDADARAAADHLGSSQLGYEAILHYQQDIRREERLRRHAREAAKWDADLVLTPALPKDWDRWVDKVGIPQNFIFYEYQRQGARMGYCSYCEEDVPLKEKPRHNKKARCPRCRHEITYKSLGRLGRWLETEEVCVHLIQARPDGFVTREFWANRLYHKADYRHPKVFCMEHWRVMYDAEHDMTPRTYYWGCYKNLSYRWIAGIPNCSWFGRDSIYINHGCKAGRVYGKTLPHLARGALKHTGLAEWIYQHEFIENPDKYMTVCRRNPVFEKIWKADLPKLTEECWNDTHGLQKVIPEPRASSLTKALGVGKRELAQMRRCNGGITFLQWMQWQKQYGKIIPEEVLQWFLSQEIAAEDLDFIREKMSPLQVYHYLQRQAAGSGESVRQVITTWRDYLSMAERLGIDTNDEIVYRVKLLRQRHDELVLRCKRRDKEQQAKEVLARFPHVDEICESIREKYEYANDDYAIVAPHGVLDIIVEGDMLNHCLRGSDRYWDRIEKQETYILFLRRASAPDTPYYTLEVEPDGTVRQKRTKFDRQEADIEDAKKFLAEWQRVIAKRLTVGDRKRAAVSRVLREQEFAQMRQDNVIIHTGELAGRRLVDVLTADLMEAA